MTEMDRERFGIALTGLAEIFNEPVSTPRMNAYFSALSDLSIDRVEAAVAQLMRTAKFFPKPIEIREALQGSTRDQAETAWRTFLKLVIEENYYPSLQVQDGTLAFAIEQFGGWIEANRRVNGASAEMLRAYENQFKVSYQLALQQGHCRSRYLVGFYEAANRENAGRMQRAQGNEILLAVCLVGTGDYQRLSMPFDLNTGQLTGAARLALEHGKVQPYLPAPTKPQALLESGAEDSEPISEFERRQILAQIQGLIKPMPAAEPDEPAEVVELGGGTPWD
jgi:hypothetical protein